MKRGLNRKGLNLFLLSVRLFWIRCSDGPPANREVQRSGKAGENRYKNNYYFYNYYKYNRYLSNDLFLTIP